MYIVNTSFFVDNRVHEKWLEIVRGYYLPLLNESGFAEVTLSRVIKDQVPDSFTYSLMVRAADMAAYTLLTTELFDKYRQVADPIFGDTVVWLVSLLKRVE